MAEKNNATCSICGNEYYVCLACRDSLKVNPWKVHTDTSEHYKIYQIIHGYSTNVYTTDEAKIKLKNVDLSDIESFRPHIKKVIKDILKPTVKTVDKIESVEEINETEVVEVKKETVVENMVKPTVSRKKNYKTEVE